MKTQAKANQEKSRKAALRRYLLELAGVEGRDIARAAKCSAAYVSMVLNGHRRNGRIEAAICKSVNKPHEELF